MNREWRQPGRTSAAFFAAAACVAFAVAFLAAAPAAQAPGAAKSKVETYYYFVFSDPAEPGQEAEYNRWYDHQHAPDVVAVPGFVTAQRYVAAETQLRNNPLPAKYLVVYKVVTDDLAAVQAEVSRRLQTKMTIMSPTFKGAQNSPGGYFKTISAVIPHKGDAPPAPKGKVETYYQFVFSNPVEGKEQEFNTWYEETHVPEVASVPGWVEGQRGQLVNPRTRPGQTTFNYVAAFKIVTDDLAAVFAAFRQRSPKMTNSAAFGQNVGYTYKAWGPLLYGDHVRAERAKSK